ncbi:hypothetical protein LWI29_007471 [Acer saccharum]|uniref:Uncharacterized protein n=1 Tax=Acer saccharum TaxID=4024 RepID=A0AA39SRB7_ACESA|nr:hypothetical protein LWI29_007471 [Acer saccharum]
MEEIFSIVGSEDEEIVLEKLESLYLRDLPKLRSFTYDEEEVGSTCDEERQMKDSLMPLFDGKFGNEYGDIERVRGERGSNMHAGC